MKATSFACASMAAKMVAWYDRDVLDGGAGSDTYVFATGHGRDILIDADGQGSISLNGQMLEAGKRLAEDSSVWEDTTGQYRLARIDNGTGDFTLLITPTAGGGSITVKNWKPGDLGLALGDEVDEQEEPAPPTLYFGDQRAPRLGIEIREDDIDATHPSYGVYDWSAVTWQPTGALLGGIEEVDFADVISAAGQSGAVKMFGFGGNDALTGAVVPIISTAAKQMASGEPVRELNPFVIPDINYAQHNTSGSFELYDPETGNGVMIKAYFAERSANQPL